MGQEERCSCFTGILWNLSQNKVWRPDGPNHATSGNGAGCFFRALFLIEEFRCCLGCLFNFEKIFPDQLKYSSSGGVE